MKSTKTIFLLIILTLFTSITFSQITLKGLVQDGHGNPIFAAHVYLKNQPQQGNLTDLDGKFEFYIKSTNDTLMVSFIGYKTKEIILNQINKSDSLMITLQGNGHALSEVIITARTPISEDFSAVQLTKMSIYLNPASQGDPLKAISFLPSATTTDESANPSFRGSSIDRTRVIFNGVPIYQPVRNTQINKIGNFSIFSTEIVDKEYAYAGNPPLTFGNTSSGLVDISTLHELPNNQLQLSAALSNFDVFLSQKIKSNSFVQLFGNYQFSGPFITLNQTNLTNLKAFDTQDIGLNYHTKISKRTELNSFNYFINEGYRADMELYTYTGPSASSKRRFFSINNFTYYTNNGVITIHTGLDGAKKDFTFGNIISDKRTRGIYASANYKHFVSKNIAIQGGLTYDYQSVIFNDTIPVYFYAQSPSSPKYPLLTNINNHNLETYLYSTWNMGQKWNFFSGLRSNIPIHEQSPYLSSQLGLKYTIDRNQSISLGVGNYNSYSVPDYYNKQFNLLKSSQISLDYVYKHNKTLFSIASFYTKETGEETTDSPLTSQNINIVGAEFAYEQYLHKYLKLTFANTYLNQQLNIDGTTYNGDKKFNYFIKASLSYTNPKLFSTSITYIGRPGNYYTPISSSIFDASTGFYIPLFSPEYYSWRYGNYNQMDINLSKYFQFDKTSLVCFISVNNILNTKNENGVLYNANYTMSYPSYYQFRTWFFGIVWSLKY